MAAHSSRPPYVSQLPRQSALIDHDFQGYKFKTPATSKTTRDLHSEVYVAAPTSEFSYVRLKASSEANHLTADPRHSGIVYYVDTQFRIVAITASIQDGNVSLSEGSIVFAASDVSPSTVDPSIIFADLNTMVFSDAKSTIYVLQRDGSPDVNDALQWKEVFRTIEVQLAPVPSPVTLLAADRKGEDLICIARQLYEDEAGVTQVRVSFVTIQIALDVHVVSSHSYTGTSLPQYAGIERDAGAIYLMTDKQFVSSSVHQPHHHQHHHVPAKVGLVSGFAWRQTSSEVEVTIPIAPNTHASQVEYKISSSHFSLRVPSSGIAVEGSLAHNVIADDCTWTIDTTLHAIIITLVKLHHHTWGHLLEGYNYIEESPSQEHVVEIVERWKHATSNTLDASSRAPLVSRTAQHPLEDCDFKSDEELCLYRYNVTDGQMTKCWGLSGQQYLFADTIFDPIHGVTGRVVVQDDVHGLVFEFHPSTTPVHVASISAFGYVQASKPDKKFMACSHDAKIGVILDCLRSAYIYHASGTAAIMDVDSGHSNLGLVVSSSFVFILTKNAIHAFSPAAVLAL